MRLLFVGVLLLLVVGYATDLASVEPSLEVAGPENEAGEIRQFESFYEYFNYFLGTEELRAEFALSELPRDYQRIIVDGAEVNLDLELLPHEVYFAAKNDWSVDKLGQREFYIELVRPSACAAQAVYGVVDLADCDVKVVSEFFGPFVGDLADLVQKQIGEQ